MKIDYAILALAVGAFAIGTSEFSPMGLLPNIADSYSITIPMAGTLITGYALGVMISAPVMTLWFNHFQRKKALILLMFIFSCGNLVASISPNYITLFIARIITSLNHGAFFGIGSVVATSIVAKNKQAAAVASMFMGLTIANIGGVPLANWFGQKFGWREAFLGITLLGVITAIFLWKAVPQNLYGDDTNIKAELKIIIRPSVLLALLTTALGAGAMFSLYTYITPSLKEITHASDNFITICLVLIGVGFSIGNYLGGYFADISLNKTLYTFLTLLITSMVLFPFTASTYIGASISLIIWGALTFGIVPALQMRVMQVASEAKSLASSINIGAFNLGNGIGALLGGIVISHYFSYHLVLLLGSTLAGLALLTAYLQTKMINS